MDQNLSRMHSWSFLFMWRVVSLQEHMKYQWCCKAAGNEGKHEDKMNLVAKIVYMLIRKAGGTLSYKPRNVSVNLLYLGRTEKSLESGKA